MQKSLFAALCLGFTAFPAISASNVFVTAGFPVYPSTVFFAIPDLMWTNTPVGQEFVSAVPFIDFADVQIDGGSAAPYHLLLREQTITGAVVAVSNPIFRDIFSSSMARFDFASSIPVTPGATYVLELLRGDPFPTTAEESPRIYRPGGDYPGGNRIWRGVSQPRSDLYFRVGLFVPPMFSTNRPTMRADGIARHLDPEATFENPYVTNFNGATLEFELNSWAGDSISLASGGTAEITIVPDTGDIYYNGGVVSLGRVLTNDASPNSITVEFNATADALAVGAILRSLLFTSSEPLESPPPHFITMLRATFTHPSGETTEAVHFGIRPGNFPPPTNIWVFGPGAFLSGNRVSITRRLERTVSVECNFGTLTDIDGDLLTFAWRRRPDETILSTLPRFTNDYAPGLHWVEAIISDGKVALDAEVSFEIITPTEAITRLRADVAQTDFGQNKRRLERPLHFAAYAIKRQEWLLATRQLEAFRHRLGDYVDSVENEELYTRWYDAAGDIKYAVARLRRGPFFPPGPFPHPGGIPIPQPR